MSTTPQLQFSSFDFSYKINSALFSNNMIFGNTEATASFYISNLHSNLINESFVMSVAAFNEAGIHFYSVGNSNYGISKLINYANPESEFTPYFPKIGSWNSLFTADVGSYSFGSDQWGTYWYGNKSRNFNYATNMTFSFYKGTETHSRNLVGVISFPFGNYSTTQNLTLSDVTANEDENGTPFSTPGINCILKGTKILTNNGESNIEDLKRGDFILNSNGEEKIIKKVYYQKVEVDISNSNRDKYKDKYSLKEGNLVVSGGHMVKLDGVYHLPITSDKFENIQTENSENEYYHLELDEYDYFVANGVEVESLCNVQSQKDEYYKERGLDFQDLIKSKK